MLNKAYNILLLGSKRLSYFNRIKYSYNWNMQLLVKIKKIYINAPHKPWISICNPHYICNLHNNHCKIAQMKTIVHTSEVN